MFLNTIKMNTFVQNNEQIDIKKLMTNNIQ